MSAESTVAFFGVRFEVGEDEITMLEKKSHPLLMKVHRNGLKTYWGNFGLKSERYLLFIGEQLGIIGIENDRQMQLSIAELANLSLVTKEKLRHSGIVEEPMIHLAWQPDIQ